MTLSSTTRDAAELPAKCKMRGPTVYCSDEDCVECGLGEGEACSAFHARADARNAEKRAKAALAAPARMEGELVPVAHRYRRPDDARWSLEFHQQHVAPDFISQDLYGPEAATRIAALEARVVEADELLGRAAINMPERMRTAGKLPENVMALRRNLEAAEARVAVLVAEGERARKVLEPFATFGKDNTDDNGWAGSRCERDRICDWLGPSDFRAARDFLTPPPAEETKL